MSVEGWQPDPFGMHEERLFSQGEPTALVRDGGVGSYHEPPNSPSVFPAGASQAVPAAPAPPMAPAPQVISAPAPGPAPAPAPAVAVTSQPHVVWTTLATTGSLVLAQSEQEFAVYDQKNNFGRWPRTEEGYRFASETYRAHSQSLAHGVAYSATGYRDPAAVGLPTDPVIKSKSYSSPLSFVGSTRRLGGWAAKTSKRSPSIGALAWVVAALAMLVAWWFILIWYFIIFGLFGVFVIPYRLVRRSSRKSLHVQQTTLATQQAMYQQMAMMQHQMQQPAPQVPTGYPPAVTAPGTPPLGSGYAPPLPPA